ncbi:nitrilase-related carbon-nitrogen hydrolase [Pararhodobacter sp. SW119]|uniref:nitrilase-related carbon-nitrogen hydrolase n=1 Tax=Pararhodobacter sp. SW119 TaxID=2780075 RepID=UPI001ADFAD29|nr:nitrilase-related carbon-nitrogen hydrolase [Pararhodobacter sp. SW119]
MLVTHSANPPEHLSLDLWAANLELPTPDLPTWLARIEHRLADAAARGVAALILPEYACAQWLAFAPPGLAPTRRLCWLAHTGSGALVSMAALSARYGVALLPGTIPHRVSGATTVTNRAWFLTPDGGAFAQDKLSLTPAEETGHDGPTLRGTTINVFPWLGLRVAMIICLDAEYTELWARLGGLDLDLVFVPAKTDMITGYNRVFGTAHARATELQIAVCVVGAAGVPMGLPASDTGVGGAAAYLPCDISISLDGVFAALPPQHAVAETSLLLQVRDLPLGQCRRIRRGAAEAEVNPASWSADHLTVTEA